MSERSYMNEEIVLCAANAYEQKFYLNPEFDALPESIKQELQIMCVLYTEDVGGILMVVFDEEGNLELKVDHEENDFFFDEIGSVLKIRELQKTKRELFESLEMFFRVFYLGEGDVFPGVLSRRRNGIKSAGMKKEGPRCGRIRSAAAGIFSYFLLPS